ncbi:protein rep [Candidatus Acetothermia bacterium]|nr:protein rep [Candidatus Acetothermia bacterium]
MASEKIIAPHSQFNGATLSRRSSPSGYSRPLIACRTLPPTTSYPRFMTTRNKIADSSNGSLWQWAEQNSKCRNPDVIKKPDGKVWIKCGCGDKLCPIHTRDWAESLNQKIMRRLLIAEPENLYFLTLTIRDIPSPYQMGGVFSFLHDSCKKLLKHLEKSNEVLWWYNRYALDCNEEKQRFHPHVHAIIWLEKPVSNNLIRTIWRKLTGGEQLDFTQITKADSYLKASKDSVDADDQHFNGLLGVCHYMHKGDEIPNNDPKVVALYNDFLYSKKRVITLRRFPSPLLKNCDTTPLDLYRNKSSNIPSSSPPSSQPESQEKVKSYLQPSSGSSTPPMPTTTMIDQASLSAEKVPKLNDANGQIRMPIASCPTKTSFNARASPWILMTGSSMGQPYSTVIQSQIIHALLC